MWIFLQFFQTYISTRTCIPLLLFAFKEHMKWVLQLSKEFTSKPTIFVPLSVIVKAKFISLKGNNSKLNVGFLRVKYETTTLCSMLSEIKLQKNHMNIYSLWRMFPPTKKIMRRFKQRRFWFILVHCFLMDCII